jgi:hypothetical protein
MRLLAKIEVSKDVENITRFQKQLRNFLKKVNGKIARVQKQSRHYGMWWKDLKVKRRLHAFNKDWMVSKGVINIASFKKDRQKIPRIKKVAKSLQRVNKNQAFLNVVKIFQGFTKVAKF